MNQRGYGGFELLGIFGFLQKSHGIGRNNFAWVLRLK
jgi:hypothetical protein